MDATGGTAPTPPGWYDDGNGALRYWDGVAWTSHVAPPPPPPPAQGLATGPPPASPLAGQPRSFWATAICAALVIVGGFGPWATALGAIDVSGTRGDGWIVIVTGALALLILFTTARTGRPAGGWTAAVLGLIGAIVGVADLSNINDRAQSATLFGDRVIDPGWGIYLVIIASAGLCIAGMALGVSRRSARRRSS